LRRRQHPATKHLFLNFIAEPPMACSAVVTPAAGSRRLLPSGSNPPVTSFPASVLWLCSRPSGRHGRLHGAPFSVFERALLPSTRSIERSVLRDAFPLAVRVFFAICLRRKTVADLFRSGASASRTVH